MAFVFLPILTKELEDFVALWNSHHIRPTRLASCPSGRPGDMFEMPQLFGMFMAVISEFDVLYSPIIIFKTGGGNCMLLIENQY